MNQLQPSTISSIEEQDMLMNEGICPECGSHRTREVQQDCELVFECDDCGFTATG